MNFATENLMDSNHATFPNRSQSLVCLFLILILAGILRWDRCTTQCLSDDESYSWRIASYSTPELMEHVIDDAHPPLYYLVLQGWVMVFGDTVLALRSLSIIFGLAGIVMAYLLCVECNTCIMGNADHSGTSRAAALFSALLLATHLAVLDEPSRNISMYSTAIFLAGMTAWLLLRAMRCPSELGWWLSYGLAVAAFCYTHYYAFFILAAQLLFFSTHQLLSACRRSKLEIGTSFIGYSVAGILALLLYWPWLPVQFKQMNEVQHSFWLPPVTFHHAQAVFCRWSSGLQFTETSILASWILFIFSCVLAMTLLRATGAIYLLAQAGIPWFLSLGLSFWSDRPIFHERYLQLAHFFLFPFWGVVWFHLPGIACRLGLFILFAGLNAVAVETVLNERHDQPPEQVVVAAILRDHYEPTDEVVVGSAPALNRLLYYANQVGVRNLRVRCSASAFPGPGHKGHFGSLRAEDVIWNEIFDRRCDTRRIWAFGEARHPAPTPDKSWTAQRCWRFADGCYLILYMDNDRHSR